MAGYTRQSAAQILNGEIVSAPPLNAEFNQVLAAFNNSTGHKHDGSAAEGPPINRIADADQRNLLFVDTSTNQINFFVEVSSTAVGQISVQDGAILPFTDDDISIGSTAFEFKDLFIDGTANIDALVADTADINAGTIDGVTIGGNSAGAGTFTVLNASSADINSGTIDNAVIGGATPAAGTFTVVNASSADIDSGTIDNAVIGGATPAAGTFTALGATNVTVTGSASSIGAVAFTSTSATITGDLSVSGSITASTLSVAGNISAASISVSNITATGSASSIGAATFTSTAVTITKLISGNVAITGGSITGITNIFDPGSAMSYTFSGTTADADPGNGGIRLNNASTTAATTIFIDNVDALSSADMTAFISLLSGGNNPSGVLGTVTLRKALFPEIFAQYSVTAVTNASGYQKLTVANKGASAAAPFTSGDSLLVDIALTGDKGDAGDGDVSGPGTTTDDAVVRFNGTNGSNLNNSGVIIDDSNNVTGVNSLAVTTNITASNITIAGSASTVGAVAFTSTGATVTGNLSVTGAVTASNITIVGSASTIGAVAFTSTGATVTGGLTVTGAVTASNITIVGSASTLGAITVTTTSVGINTAAVTSGTALEVTGNVRITTTGNGLIFPDGSKQESAASGGTGIAIAMALIFG